MAAALPLGLNLLIFGACGAAVWVGGTRLSRYGKVIAERTGLGQAVVGTLLLGVIVSLPELAMASAAAAMGDGALAVNILLGGVTFTMVVLAITDAIIGKEPLSSDIRKPVVLLQGAFVTGMLALTAMAITVHDVPLLGVGAWSMLIFGCYLLCLWLVRRGQRSDPWVPDPNSAAEERLRSDRARAEAAEALSGGGSSRRRAAADESAGNRPAHIVTRMAVAAAVVLGAGVLLARTADVLAVQTGLGKSFVGFILGGIVTSLPELSSTVSAVRLRQYEMTFSDAFGTNLCSLSLLLVADAFYAGGPILNEVGPFSLFATLLGTLVTATYLTGLVARPKRSHLRMGLDSIVVLGVSAVGFWLLYRLA